MVAAAFDAVAETEIVTEQIPAPASTSAKRVPVTPKSILRLSKSKTAWGSARRVRTPRIVSRRAMCEASEEDTGDVHDHEIVTLSPLPPSEALGTAKRIPTGRKPPRSERKRGGLEPLTEDATEMGSRVSFEVIKGKKKKGAKARASFLSPVRRSARVAATSMSGRKLGGGASLQHLAMMISSKDATSSKPSFESLLEEADFNYRPNAALASRSGANEDDLVLSPSSASTPGKSPKCAPISDAKDERGSSKTFAKEKRGSEKKRTTPLRRSKRLRSRKPEAAPPKLLG